MNSEHNKNDLLSALFDGAELSQSELELILSDEELISKWSEYSKIRATIRNELPDGIVMDKFATNVMEKIAIEPIYVSVNNDTDLSNVANGNDEYKNEVENNKSFKQSNFKRGIWQSTIAASVACVCAICMNVVLSNNSDMFVEQSVINNSGLQVTPVSNPFESYGNKVMTPMVNQNIVNSNIQGVDDRNSALMKQIELQRAKEIEVLDAILTDHDRTKKLVSVHEK